MKFLIMLALCTAGVAGAETIRLQKKDNSDLMPKRYLPNDGSAMPGNPGVFPQEQEAEKEEEVLDMSTAPENSKLKEKMNEEGVKE